MLSDSRIPCLVLHRRRCFPAMRCDAMLADDARASQRKKNFFFFSLSMLCDGDAMLDALQLSCAASCKSIEKKKSFFFLSTLCESIARNAVASTRDKGRKKNFFFFLFALGESIARDSTLSHRLSRAAHQKKFFFLSLSMRGCSVASPPAMLQKHKSTG